jgi:hypothetical protein
MHGVGHWILWAIYLVGLPVGLGGVVVGTVRLVGGSSGGVVVVWWWRCGGGGGSVMVVVWRWWCGGGVM